VAAINSLSSQVGVDWRLFCENFMAGKVYSSPAVFPSAADIQGLTIGQYYFTSPTTTGTTFTGTYGDLSAKVYSIGIQQPGWSQGTTLSLSLNAPGGEAEAIVYQFTPPGTLTKLAVFQNSYDIPNAENLTGKGQGLVIMVSEGHSVAPYTGSTQINLTVTAGGLLAGQLQQTKYVKFTLHGSNLVQVSNVGPTHTSTESDIVFGNRDPWGTVLATLEWTGSQFQAKSAANCTANGYPCQVDIEGQVDVTKQVLTSATGLFKAFTGGMGTIDTITMNVQNLPLSQDTWGIPFCASGADVKGSVSNVTWVSTFTDGRPYLQYISTDWTAAPTPSICVEFSTSSSWPPGVF